MKTKHTPGPWSLNEPTLIWAESVGENVAKTHIEDWDVIPREQMEANARLIAAAPELLEALEELMSTLTPKGFEPTQEQWAMTVKARAAIAKATGGV